MDGLQAVLGSYGYLALAAFRWSVFYKHLPVVPGVGVATGLGALYTTGSRYLPLAFLGEYAGATVYSITR